MSTLTSETRSVVDGDEPIRAKTLHGIDGNTIVVLYIGEWPSSAVIFQGTPQAMVSFADRARNAVLEAVQEVEVTV